MNKNYLSDEDFISYLNDYVALWLSPCEIQEIHCHDHSIADIEHWIDSGQFGNNYKLHYPDFYLRDKKEWIQNIVSKRKAGKIW